MVGTSKLVNDKKVREMNEASQRVERERDEHRKRIEGGTMQKRKLGNRNLEV